MNENLIPLNERTKDEQREIQTLGGIKSGEARRAKKTMREMLDYLLEKEIKTNKGDMSTLEAIMVSAIAKASKGDIRAIEFIRDTIGQKPTEKTEFVGEFTQLVLRRFEGKDYEDKNDGNSRAVSASDRAEEKE